MKPTFAHRGKGRLMAGIASIGLWLLCLPVQAADCQRKLRPIEGDWREHRSGEFIFQYTLAGKHALQSPADTVASGVPDMVADVQVQLVAMREMLQSLQFQLPLDSPRYQSQGASHILVRFQKLQGNGLAFDEVSRLPSGECVLMIQIASHYRSGNLTPAHELFHQVQNGYTMFKRPWFYEGTARWSETLLGRREVNAQPVPADTPDLQALWKQSYSAVGVWHGLIGRCSSASAPPKIPAAVRSLRYRNGQPVMQDSRIPGHDYILRVLEALGTLSDETTATQGLTAHRWPEKVQRDAQHDAAMWRAVQNACQPG